MRRKIEEEYFLTISCFADAEQPFPYAAMGPHQNIVMERNTVPIRNGTVYRTCSLFPVA